MKRWFAFALLLLPQFAQAPFDPAPIRANTPGRRRGMLGVYALHALGKVKLNSYWDCSRPPLPCSDSNDSHPVNSAAFLS
ncbi:MAG TPA: hypothetical protein VIS99_14430 [Terrimicrobiaceae bacterium]